MPMNDSRKKLIAAGASTVTSAAFQITILIGGNWIRVHVNGLWVLPLWAIAIGLWIWWFVSRGSKEVKRTNPSFSSSDPRVFVEFVDEREGQLHKRTYLRLWNRGSSDALDVHIEDIQLRANKISFPHTAGAIAPDSCERFNPKTDGRWGTVNTCLLVRALVDEWESYKDITMARLAIPLRITYQNCSRDALLETTCKLIFDPYVEVSKVVRQGVSHSGRKLIAFEDYTFKKIAENVSA